MRALRLLCLTLIVLLLGAWTRPTIPEPAQYGGNFGQQLPGYQASGVFTPSSVPGLVGRYICAVGMPVNGGVVQSWADQSGNGNNLTMGSTGPSNGSTINGVACPTFDGATTTIGTTSFSGTINAAFVVLRAASQPLTAEGVVFSTSGSGGVMEFFVQTNQVIGISAGTGAFGGGGDSLITTAHTFIANFHVLTNSNLYLDGSLIINGPGGSNTGGATVQIGSYPGYIWTGPIAEVALYSQTVSSANLAALHAYAQSTWGSL